MQRLIIRHVGPCLCGHSSNRTRVMMRLDLVRSICIDYFKLNVGYNLKRRRIFTLTSYISLNLTSNSKTLIENFYNSRLLTEGDNS